MVEHAERVVTGLEVRSDVARVALLTGADREVQVVAWRILAGVGVAAVEELVRERPDEGAVAALGGRQRLRKERPQLLRVHRDDRRGDHVVALHRPRVRRIAGRGQRVRVGLLDQRVIGVPGVLAAEAEAGALIRRASLEEAPERPFEAGRLLAKALHRPVDVVVGVEGTVEHHRAVVTREQARVRGAEERAVGEAEVVELALVQRGAEQVHITRHVGGRHVRQDAVVKRDAARDVARVLLDKRARNDVERRLERLGVNPLRLLVRPAVDRRLALADAARVHPDQIEALVERREAVGAEGLEEIGDRGAGPAEVQKQRADPVRLIRGGRAGDEHVDLAVIRPVVVQRGAQRRALHIRRVAARREVQRRRVSVTCDSCRSRHQQRGRDREDASEQPRRPPR